MVSKAPSVIHIKEAEVSWSPPNKTCDFLKPFEYIYLGTAFCLLLIHPTCLLSCFTGIIISPYLFIPHPQLCKTVVENPRLKIHGGYEPTLKSSGESMSIK